MKSEQAPGHAGVLVGDETYLPYQKFVLDNGLTVILHEDHKAPIVAVNIWYHVGSKNEKAGKSGFAHLFEHLMFNGSEHFNDDYFQAMQAIGATDLNGTTNNDRTNYFQNVPTGALDRVLWLESDRMGHLLGAIDQAKLDEQRGVVQNEKRQMENQPYARQWELITHEMFPPEHPYGHTVVGSMEDLDNATVEDVHDWFNTYYGAANACLVIAGDITPESALKKVRQYFGHIPSGPTIVQPQLNIPRRLGETRTTYTDRVPEARINMVWNTPQAYSKEDVLLNLAASILSHGKTSRLYHSVIYSDQLATSIHAVHWAKEIAGNFIIQANARPGELLERIESRILQVLQEFLDHGPTEQELQRAKSQYFSGFIKGMERIGGFGGKSDILANSAVFGGSPDAYLGYNDTIRNATVAEIKEICRKWLSDGKFTLTCHPFPDYGIAEPGIDRSTMPEVPDVRTPAFPGFERRELSNGLKLILARRTDVPVVVMNAIIHAGFSSDTFRIPGLCTLTMNMLDAGTHTRNTLEISEDLQKLGATLTTSASIDTSSVTMKTLKSSFQESLALFADVLMNPAFPSSEFDRSKAELIAQVMREQVTPVPMALRVLPRFLFGAGHPYAMPLTGSGFVDSLEEISREDVISHYQGWMRPNNTTIVVVGDVDIDHVCESIEQHLQDWKPVDIPARTIPVAAETQGNILYLQHRAESQQSVVIAGYLTAPYGEVSEEAAKVMNDILGGQFISRLNLNLREDKHWTYGAGSFLVPTNGQRVLVAYAPVQIDKTADTIREIRHEFELLVGSNPIQEEEFEKDKQNSILKLPGLWETNAAIANAISQLVVRDLADDHFNQYPRRMLDLTIEQVRAVSNKMICPEKLTWFVVGDVGKIRSQLDQLAFDAIYLLDTNGNVIGNN